MPPRVRIQRKKKPFLHTQTKQLFAFGDLCANILSMSARYAGNADREDYQRARTERTEADVHLKYARLEYVNAQTERTHLLNQQTRAALALIEVPRIGETSTGTSTAVKIMQHNCPRCNGLVDVPPSSETAIEITCPHCTQEWEIYPQGAEVMQ